MSQSETAVSLGQLSVLLSELRTFRAGPLSGDPSNRALARTAGVSPTTIGNWLTGTQFPQDIGKMVAVVRAVSASATAQRIADPDGKIAALLDEKRWREAHRMEASRRAGVVSASVRRAQAIQVLATPLAGRPLAEVSDPFALEVHHPVRLDQPQPDMPVLPTYLPRDHDGELRRVVVAAMEGSSGIAVLVGGSSTGKTRACWEALQLLRECPEPWRLWHPIDPTRPDAALRELPTIGPRTVVWLNDAQFYLDIADGLGEQVAAGLRELLRDPRRTPVLVLATLWPELWHRLITRPTEGVDPHPQARELLADRDIAVPTAFTPTQTQRLRHAKDARVAQAAAAAQDGQVIQFLAGAPELLARYRNAPPGAKALIHAAMDARRLEGLTG